MQEKFFKLSKGIRWIIVLAAWALTVGSFLATTIIKNTKPIYALEITLTCVGILFCVIAICLTIVQLTYADDNKKTTDESVESKEN